MLRWSRARVKRGTLRLWARWVWFHEVLVDGVALFLPVALCRLGEFVQYAVDGGEDRCSGCL